MPKKIQNPALTSQLVTAFDLKGRAEFELDDIVVPVVVAADIVQHPRQDAGTRFGDIGAVALENGFVGVRPAPGRVLSVLGFEIVNATAGARVYTARILTDSNFFTLTPSVTATTGLFLTNREDPAPAVGGAMPETASRMFEGTRVGAVGSQLALFRFVQDTTFTYRFPEPPLLFGGALAAAAVVATNRPTAVVVWSNTVNEALNVTFHTAEQSFV